MEQLTISLHCPGNDWESQMVGVDEMMDLAAARSIVVSSVRIIAEGDGYVLVEIKCPTATGAVEMKLLLG